MTPHLFYELAGSAWSTRLAEVLLHFLWQGLAIALAAWVMAVATRRVGANWRYRVYTTALLGMALCVPVTFGVVTARDGVGALLGEARDSLPIPATTGAASLQPLLVDPLLVNPPVESMVRNPMTSSDATAETPRSDGIIARLERLTLSEAAPWLLLCYLMGVGVMSLRLAVAVWGGHRLRRTSVRVADPRVLVIVQDLTERFGLRAVPAIATCGRIAVPMVIGLVKPFVLVPPALATGLTASQLEAILSHEILHLKRFDLLLNFAQRTVEAALFFHPAVWFVSRRMSREREYRCDDLVVARGCDRLVYADALVRMAELCGETWSEKRVPGAAMLAATGGSSSEFKRRVLRIMGEPMCGMPRVSWAGAAGVMLVVLALGVGSWVMAAEKNPPEVELPPEPAKADDASLNDLESKIDPLTLMLYQEYLASRNNREYAAIVNAIELVANRSHADENFQQLLLRDLRRAITRHDQWWDGRQTLNVVTAILREQGRQRWFSDILILQGHRPPRTADEEERFNTMSPLLQAVLEAGHECDERMIAEFAFAARQAHHPGCRAFLEAVLHSSLEEVGTAAETAENSKGESHSLLDVKPSMGGTKRLHAWTIAKFVAAIGLAELGDEQGVAWLIEHSNPATKLPAGDIYGYFHIDHASRRLPENCKRALHDLAKMQWDKKENACDWHLWWAEKRDSFRMEQPVRLREQPIQINSLILGC